MCALRPARVSILPAIIYTFLFTYLRLKMVPLLRPNVWSYNRGRPTSSVSVPSTLVAVDRSLILQLSRRVCPGSQGPHPPLGSARYTCVFQGVESVCVGRGRGQNECAVLFLGVVCSFLFFHLLLLLPRVQRVLISPGSPQPTRLGQSQNTQSTLASSLNWEHSQAPWHSPASTAA